MVIFSPIVRSQTTYTANLIKADTAEITFTKCDSIKTNSLRVADSICTGKDIFVGQDAKVSGNIAVSGDAYIQGKLRATQGLFLDPNASQGIFYLSNNGTESVIYGKKIPNVPPPPPPIMACNTTVTPVLNHQFGGAMQIFATQNSSYVPGSSVLNIVSDTWGSSIDASEGGLNLSQKGLLINYFCGNDTYINTGTMTVLSPSSSIPGGKVFVGSFLQARKHVEIGDSVIGIQNDNNNIGLLIHTHSGAGLKVRTYSPGLNAISVHNTGSSSPNNFNGQHTFYVKGNGETGILTTAYSPAFTIRSFMGSATSPTVFMVMGDGRTYIGKEKVVGTHSDALLQVAGKAAAKSFYVLKPTTWADEVFENKATPDIKEIENFIKKHKHLPEIPSEKDVTENGYDVHEMNRLLLKKIEELYLIVIEQGKEIERMKKNRN